MFNLHAYDRNLPHVKLGHQNRIYSNRHERAPRAAATTVETTALENFQLYVGLTVFKTYTPFSPRFHQTVKVCFYLVISTQRKK